MFSMWNRWKDHFVRVVAPCSGMHILDLASGTGTANEPTARVCAGTVDICAVWSDLSQ